MPAYIVKIRKPEEIRVNKRTFYKIKVTKTDKPSSESKKRLKFETVKRSAIYYGAKPNKPPRNSYHDILRIPNSRGSNRNEEPGGQLLQNRSLLDKNESIDEVIPHSLSPFGDQNWASLPNRSYDGMGSPKLYTPEDQDRTSPKIPDCNNNSTSPYLDNTGMRKSESILRIGSHCPALNGCDFSAKRWKGSSNIISFTSKKVDDVIDEILNLEDLDSEGPMKHPGGIPSPQKSQVPSSDVNDLLELGGISEEKLQNSATKPDPSARDPQIIAFLKDRQKKDNHNMIERRRRFNINDRIRDLSQLLPKTNEPYHEIVRDIRHNKGQILRASVDYIQRLKSDLEMSKNVEVKRKTLEEQNRQLLLRIQDLENQLRKNGIQVEESPLDLNIATSYQSSSTSVSVPLNSLTPTSSPYNIITPQASPFTTTPTSTPTPITSPLSQIKEAPPFISSNDGDFLSSDAPAFGALDFSESFGGSGTEGKNATADDEKKNQFPDFLLDELFMTDFDGSIGLNLMDDENLSFPNDPMFSSPQPSSPNSSHHSYDDVLTPESMDTAS